MIRRAVLVHGAWHGSWVWDPVLPLLREQGIGALTIDLPSSHTGGDLRADAEAVRALVLGADVDSVLVGHSYGGVAITEAALALPSVRHLVYICGALLEAGESITSASGGAPAQEPSGVEPELVQAPDPGRTLLCRPPSPARCQLLGKTDRPDALLPRPAPHRGQLGVRGQHVPRLRAGQHPPAGRAAHDGRADHLLVRGRQWPHTDGVSPAGRRRPDCARLPSADQELTFSRRSTGAPGREAGDVSCLLRRHDRRRQRPAACAGCGG